MLCSLPVLGFGQILLYNDGAMVKVQAGAVLYIQGGIQNTSTGTIDNDGTIEVEGNFVNAGAWEPSQPNTLRFSGTGNSDVTSGPAVFQTVEDIKTGGGNINLMDPMTVNTDLNFNSAGTTRIVTGNFDLILGNACTVTGPSATEYVATTGTGMMQKGVTASSTFLFPIGDIVNYSPLSCNYSGTYSSANLRAKANDLTHPSNPWDATDYISRYWDINQTGISSYSNTLTGTYIPADIVGSASLIKGAVHNGTDWFYVNSAGGANTVTATTTDPTADFTGTNFYGKADLKVFLTEAMPAGGVPPMVTELWNGQTVTGCGACPNLIPTGSPYSAAPWNAPSTTAPSIPASTVDWILVETRDPSINIISQTSAFLKNDGAIVGADGGPLRLKNAVPSAIISIRHRNHLGIRTPVAMDLINPGPTYNFSTDTTQAWRNPAISNSNMRLIGTTWCLWGGNANLTTSGLTKVSYLGLQNDPSGILSAMGNNNNNPQLEIYHIADVNMNRKVSYLGLANDPATVLSNMGNNNNNPRLQHLQ